MKLGLHKALHHNAQELKPAVKGFAKAVERGADWEELIVRGAPKALGDVFLACVGAVVLDAAVGRHAASHDKLLGTHMQHCVRFKPRRPDSVRHRTPEDAEVHALMQFLNRAGTTLRNLSLAPLHRGRRVTPMVSCSELWNSRTSASAQLMAWPLVE